MSSETDAAFVERLKNSQQFVQLAAQVLTEMGLPVVIEPLFIRPEVNQRAEYADGGDIKILQTVEVKHRIGLNFTCREDYPYPTIIVDMCSSFDKKRPRPYMYLIFNDAATHYAVVMCRDATRWQRVKKKNKYNGVTSDYYICTVELATFHKVEPQT